MESLCIVQVCNDFSCISPVCKAIVTPKLSALLLHWKQMQTWACCRHTIGQSHNNVQRSDQWLTVRMLSD